MNLFARLDAYGTDDPDFHEGHLEDRCPVCDRPVIEHPGQSNGDHGGLVRFEWGDGPAKWPHRRAALAAIIVDWFDGVTR